LVGFNHKQLIIDSFKHCTLTVVTDGSEGLLIHCLEPNQPYTAGLHRLKGLYYLVLQERQDPSETSEGPADTYTDITKKPVISDHDLGEIKKAPPLPPARLSASLE